MTVSKNPGTRAKLVAIETAKRDAAADAIILDAVPLGGPSAHLTQEQAQVWRDMVKTMPDGWFKEVDREVMCGYCAATTILRQATEAYNRDFAERGPHALVFYSERGAPVTAPFLKLIDLQSMTLRSLALALGVDPLTRDRIRVRNAKLNPPAPEKPVNKFSAKGF